MPPEFLCHLPFLRLPPGTDQPLAGDARLGPLPFREWLALEDPAMDYHERRYEKVAPVFVRAPLPDGDSVGELTEAQAQAADEIVERAPHGRHALPACDTDRSARTLGGLCGVARTAL